MDAHSEFQLIERIKQGDRNAFEILVDKYKHKALSIALRFIGNLEDAQEITQGAFLRAYSSLKNFRAEARFYTWFYRILVNLCRDYQRRKARYSKVFVEPFVSEQEPDKQRPKEVADLTYKPDKAVMNSELRNMIDSAIALLPQRQKTVFILKHLEGLKLKSISQILRCRESTVKVHLFRAVENLRKHLLPYVMSKL